VIAAGDLLPLRIEKPAVGGRMIARTDGLVVLVSGAIPGERVQARVERVGKGVVYATTVQVDEASPDRQPAAGDLLCGGCLYGHMAYARQLQVKSLVIADAFARIGRVQLPGAIDVAPSGPEGYRMRARVHVRGALVGFFREGSHDVCDARQTGQLLPSTCAALDRFVAEMAALGIEGVQELDVAENVDASQRVVAFDSPAPVPGAWLDRLAAGDGLSGVSSPHGARGDEWVTDLLTVGGETAISLRRHVRAFFQGNRYLLDRLVAHVVAQVPADGEVFDLYAGVGLFSVATAAVRGVRVVAVEGDRVAAADLAANALTANGEVVPVHRSVEAFVGTSGRASGGRGRDGARGRRQPSGSASRSTVIVDPPRTGMSHAALDGVMRLGAGRIVYVSCDVATLARDARRLVDHGYVVGRADAFDLFPNTPHVETVAVFDLPDSHG
jgi:23S rRNA (uracil1939-C5)-methyltransferase